METHNAACPRTRIGGNHRASHGVPLGDEKVNKVNRLVTAKPVKSDRRRDSLQKSVGNYKMEYPLRAIHSSLHLRYNRTRGPLAF